MSILVGDVGETEELGTLDLREVSEDEEREK